MLLDISRWVPQPIGFYLVIFVCCINLQTSAPRFLYISMFFHKIFGNHDLWNEKLRALEFHSFGYLLDIFSGVFWISFGCCLISFGCFLDVFLLFFGYLLGVFSISFGYLLEVFWLSFGCLLDVFGNRSNAHSPFAFYVTFSLTNILAYYLTSSR